MRAFSREAESGLYLKRLSLAAAWRVGVRAQGWKAGAWLEVTVVMQARGDGGFDQSSGGGVGLRSPQILINRWSRQDSLTCWMTRVEEREEVMVPPRILS